MMGAGDNSRLDPFGHPGLDHEVADLGLDAHQVAGLDADSCSAWLVWIHIGLVWAISSSHLALALLVWICTGSLKVEIRTCWSCGPCSRGGRGTLM